MAWNNAVVTNSGVAMLQQVLAGQTLTIDNAGGGSGTVLPAALMAQTALVNKKQTFPVVGLKNVTNGKKINILITNVGLVTGYTMQQVGIWAHVGAGASALFAILQDDAGITISSETDLPDFALNFYAIVDFSNESSFALTVDPSALVSVSMMNAAIDDAAAGKLDNAGDGSDVTAAFTEAATRTNISTGEKLSVLLGKIKKWFSDLGAAAFKDVGITSNDVAAGNAPSSAVTAHEEAADPHEQYALDTELATLQTEVTTHKADYTSKFAVLERYALASVTGQALTVTVANGKELGDREPIMVEVDSAVAGGAITVNYNDAGALALKDIDGNAVTELTKGLHQFQYRIGTPDFFVLAPKGGSSVKSVQHGTVVIGANLTVNITINAVDTTKTIVKIAQVAYSGEPCYTKAKAKLTSSTNLQLTVDSIIGVDLYTLAYEIIEFNNVKSLQKGDKSITASPTTVGISSVDLNKSMLFYNYKTSKSGSGDYEVNGQIYSQTSLRFSAVANAADVYWQVIEFK